MVLCDRALSKWRLIHRQRIRFSLYSRMKGGHGLTHRHAGLRRRGILVLQTRQTNRQPQRLQRRPRPRPQKTPTSALTQSTNGAACRQPRLVFFFNYQLPQMGRLLQEAGFSQPESAAQRSLLRSKLTASDIRNEDFDLTPHGQTFQHLKRDFASRGVFAK